MSAVTCTRYPTLFGNVDERREQAGDLSWFSRLVGALHHSRELQAAREIERYRHLIDANDVADVAFWPDRDQPIFVANVS